MMKSAIRIPQSAIQKPAPSRSAFTLIEMLVIIAVLLLLVGIFVPALDLVRQEMRAKLTQTNITMIATACDLYANDFDNTPPPSTDNQPNPNRRYFKQGSDRYGKKIIVLLLTGYAGDDTDVGVPYDAPSESMNEDDGKSGFGFRIAQRGKVYGPYNGTEKIPTIRDGNNPPVFADAFGNEILYYRADSGDFIKGDNPDTVQYVQSTSAGDHTGPYDDRGILYLITSPGKNGTFNNYGSDNDDVKNVPNPPK